MPLTILVVDDDEGTRVSISDYLELAGYTTVDASNGAQALSLLENRQPHLMVTDIAMPGMSGYELVRQLREKPAFRLLPVIFLTARTATQERIQGYRVGCDVYLEKPFELDELGAIVRNLLERSQLIQTSWWQQSSLAVAATASAVAVEMAPPMLSVPELTKREEDVLCLLADGLSNAQIGDRLFLSPRTIEKYVSSLLRKTNTSSRTELIRYALDHKLLT